MTLDSVGNIVVSGYETTGPAIHFALARFTSSGVLDTTFGIGGTQYLSTAIAGGTNDRSYGINTDSSGSIFVTGTSNNYFSVVKFTGPTSSSPSIQAIAAQIQIAQTAGTATVTANIANFNFSDPAYTTFVTNFNNQIAQGQPVRDAFIFASDTNFKDISDFYRNGINNLVANGSIAGLKLRSIEGDSFNPLVALFSGGFFSGVKLGAELPDKPLLYACALYAAGYAKSLNQQSPKL